MEYAKESSKHDTTTTRNHSGCESFRLRKYENETELFLWRPKQGVHTILEIMYLAANVGQGEESVHH